VRHLVHRLSNDLVAAGRIEPQERGRREIDRPDETARDDRRPGVERGRPPDLLEAPAVIGDPQRHQPVVARHVDRPAVVRGPAERTAAHRRRCDLAPDATEVVRGARDPRTVAAWKDKGKTAVRIDLDDPESFP